MNIYIEVENFYKEFPGNFFLALNYVCKEKNIYIAHRSDIQDSALKNLISPGIIHLKDANSLVENYDAIKKLSSKGFIFTSQDAEPGLTIEDYSEFANIRMLDGKTFNFIEYYFSWGKRDYEILKKKFGKYKTNFVIAGSPKLDFLKNFKINENQKKEFKSKFGIKKKIILIPTSISFPIAIRRMADWMYSFKEGKELHEKMTIEKRFFETFYQATKNLEKIIELIRYLEKEIKDFEIIIKSHPDEKIADWKKLIDLKSEKIHYIDNISVGELLMYSDIMIQNGSSVVLDAYLSKKKIITFEPYVFSTDTNKSFPNSFGKKFKTKEDIKLYLENESFEILENKTNNKILEERLNNLKDQDYSCQIFSKAWDEIYKNKFLNTKSFFKINHTKINNRNFRRFLKQFISRYIKLDDSRNIIDQKFPNLDMNYVLRLFENLALQNQEFKDIKIRKIGDRILEIKKF